MYCSTTVVFTPPHSLSERTFDRRQRHIEITLCVFPVDTQGARKADWHLRHAGEIFDVARQRRRIDRIAADMLQAGARLPLRKLTTPARSFIGVVVVFVARNALTPGIVRGCAHLAAFRRGENQNRDFVSRLLDMS
jgi:hypothetical protein